MNVRITGGAVVNLPAVLNQRYGNDTPLGRPFNPATASVGEVWIDTQFELTAGKDKPGSATQVNATSWSLVRKVALPRTNEQSAQHVGQPGSESDLPDPVVRPPSDDVRPADGEAAP